MKLATVDDVLYRMNLSATSPGANTDGINSSLETATSVLENLLQTPIRYQRLRDFFSIKNSYYAQVTYPFTLYLTQQFIRDDVAEPVSVYVNNAGKNLAKEPDVAYLYSVDNYVTDERWGEITFFAHVNNGPNVIAVEYSAGFKEDEEIIPKWLKDAAVSASIAVQQTSYVSRSKKDNPEAGRNLYRQVYNQVSEYVKPHMNGIEPSMSYTLNEET